MVFPGEGFDPAPTLARSQSERCTALHGVPTMFIAELDHPRLRAASTSRSLRTGIMAGAPCPIEMMKRVIARDAHARGDDRLRHDRDQPGQFPDSHRRSARAPRRDGRPHPCRTSKRRSSTPTARRRAAARRGELCTRGYSVMLGYWDDAGAHRRGHRRRRLDAHRRPGRHRRRRLLQHRRPRART